MKQITCAHLGIDMHKTAEEMRMISHKGEGRFRNIFNDAMNKIEESASLGLTDYYVGVFDKVTKEAFVRSFEKLGYTYTIQEEFAPWKQQWTYSIRVYWNERKL